MSKIMKLKAINNSILLADLFVFEKTLIDVVDVEGYSLFSYIIDADVMCWDNMFDEIRPGKFTLRHAWKGDILPGVYAYEFIGGKPDVILYESDDFVIFPGEFVRRVRPHHIIGVMDNIEEVGKFIERYVIKHRR